MLWNVDIEKSTDDIMSRLVWKRRAFKIQDICHNFFDAERMKRCCTWRNNSKR